MFHSPLTNLTANMLKPQKQMAAVLCVPDKSPVHLIIEAELFGRHWSITALWHNVDTNSGFLTRNPKASLTSARPSDRKVKQTQRTSIPVFSILVLSCFLRPLWLPPPFCLCFYTCQLSITLMLITVSRQRAEQEKKNTALFSGAFPTWPAALNLRERKYVY